MSVQLIVYPQNYQGFSNSNNLCIERIVDGIDFTTVNNSTNLAIPGPLPQSAVNFFLTMNLNTWYRYYNTDSTNISEVATVLRIIAESGEQNGIMQKVAGLTVGSVYDIELVFNVSVVGTSTLQVFSGNVLNSITPISGATTQTIQFTAYSNQETIVIDSRYSTVNNLLELESISICDANSTPSIAIQDLSDGQVIVDLYENENLPLTLSVDDFKNAAEKVQSYSKAFDLPATKRNNRIFDQMFEVTRYYDGYIFNPYQRTKCILKQDGFILFEGYLRMLDITDKLGEISYNVNLYAEVVAFADTLQDRLFSDLSFEELEHDYNRTEIENSWNNAGTGIAYTNPNTSGFRDNNSTVKYPFIDWNHQIIVGGSGSSAAIIDMPELTNLETAFRPCINIKYLIDRIFEATDFTYESTFFNTTDFKKLYMDFNWGGENVPVPFGTNSTGTVAADQIATQVFTTVLLDDNNYDTNAGYGAVTPGVFTPVFGNTTYSVVWGLRIVNPLVVSTIEVRWIMVKAGVTSQVDYDIQQMQVNLTTNQLLSGSFAVALDVGDTLHCEFRSSVLGANSYITDFNSSTNQATVSLSGQTSSNNSIGQTLRGELGQWDFLKGLITMFNLVTLPDSDNPNNIKIEPYRDVFITPGLTIAPLDWTDKIDISQIKLKPLTDLNRKNIFRFVEDDDDYAFNQYKALVTGHLYGSKKYDAGDAFNILSGEDEIIAEPFAATVIKPLMTQFPEFVTPAIYAMSEDGESEGFENSPRIMYNNGVRDMVNTSYYIPNQNGVTDINNTEFLQFSHLSELPTSSAATSTTLDFHFGACQLLTGDQPTPNNLFNLYWLPYYSELYNPNTRTMVLKVNLSPSDINLFKFNSTIFIKNRVFRVNKIDYKPNDLATVEFILIP